MKVLFFLACSLLPLLAIPIFTSDEDLRSWEQFKIKYNKSYASKDEEKYRLKIFLDRKFQVIQHNEKYEKGEVSFKLGINKYSDMSQNEINEKLNGYKNGFNDRQGAEPQEKMNIVTFKPSVTEDVPSSFNWITKGAVTPVKDQGFCSSCWAFSSTGALEGQHFRKTGLLVSLSEQNLIDCSTPEGNGGCGGGLMNFSYTYVKENGGIDTEMSYPYDGIDMPCRYNPKNVGATDTGYADIEEGSEEQLKIAVATIGPISVAINANRNFSSYSEGIFDDPTCLGDESSLNHAVLVVGYGTDKVSKKDYWLVKNSWSEGWGELGYVRMVRNKNNQCGIATAADYPLN